MLARVEVQVVMDDGGGEVGWFFLYRRGKLEDPAAGSIIYLAPPRSDWGGWLKAALGAKQGEKAKLKQFVFEVLDSSFFFFGNKNTKEKEARWGHKLL